MSIPANTHCVECLLKKHITLARSLGSEEKAYRFIKAVMQLFLAADAKDSSAILGKRIEDLYPQWYGLPKDRFAEEKKMSNRFVMERMEKLRSRVESAADPVLMGLQYAILGNYIDFSALWKDVSFEKLDRMLEQPERFSVDGEAVAQFRKELETAGTLLYLTDNAGELGFDRIFAETLQKAYPQLRITFCVRGQPVHNDATIEDYCQLEIPFPVMDNGSNIGGTDLDSISPETIAALENADVVLAKGMGNTETLWGCGYNIYYAFLVKCQRLSQVFDKPLMSAMFIREKV